MRPTQRGPCAATRLLRSARPGCQWVKQVLIIPNELDRVQFVPIWTQILSAARGPRFRLYVNRRTNRRIYISSASSAPHHDSASAQSLTRNEVHSRTRGSRALATHTPERLWVREPVRGFGAVVDEAMNCGHPMCVCVDRVDSLGDSSAWLLLEEYQNERIVNE